jgi:hypothetical protein
MTRWRVVEVTPVFPCVILNEVKNPYLSRTATIGVKEPQDWILRLAFGKSQNDTRKCSTLPQFPLCVILNEVKNPFLSHTATAKVKEPWAGFFVALYAPHGRK